MNPKLRWRPSRPGSTTGAWYVDTLDGVPWFRVPEATTREDRSKAEAYRVEIVATRARLGAERARKDAKGETCAEWFERYYDLAEEGKVGRKNRGKAQAAVDDRRSRYTVHIARFLEGLTMAEVTADHLRALVAHLDEQIRVRLAHYESDEEIPGRAPGMAAKTAAHIWSEITSAFREARSSKLAELRVSGIGEPTKDVAPPERTDERAQAALYPSELLQLLSCEAIPLERRRLYAVAAYSGMRRGELERLTAEHIDLEHNVLRVPGTKSEAARRHTPIEPTLRPLLEALVAERPSGLLLDVPGYGGSGTSALAKADLQTARLMRPELSRDDADHRPFTFHGLRHTAVTHAYLAGRDATWLRIAYGHTSSEMTRRYLDSAAMARSTFGTPFPALPAGLLSASPYVVTATVTTIRNHTKLLDKKSGRRDLKARDAEENPSFVTESCTPEEGRAAPRNGSSQEHDTYQERDILRAAIIRALSEDRDEDARKLLALMP